MVPVIDYSEELSKVLNYNEQKVQRGTAELIHAENFLKPASKLNFLEKFQRFDSLNQLRDDVKLNTLHVSLNFHPEDELAGINLQKLTLLHEKSRQAPLSKEELKEIALVEEKLREIAAIYMDRIEMAEQPYLIYQHYDAGHPHIHIVSTLIRSNGIRVKTHNMGKIASVKARKEIDQIYGLKKVEDSQHTKIYEPDPLSAQKVTYGKIETKKAIKDVLRFVLKKYRFSSLPELNAILLQYNVLADRGKPGSRIFQSGGLVYRVLNDGKPVGVPIKASDFYFKPTLKELQGKFQTNYEARKRDLPEIKGRIDWVIAKKPKTFQAWIGLLNNERIQVVVRRNEKGAIYGLTYVDYKTKTVVNGSDLGKAYSANSIIQSLFDKDGHSSVTPSISEVRGKKERSLPVRKTTSEGKRHQPTKNSPINKEPKRLPQKPPRATTKGHQPIPAVSQVNQPGQNLLQNLLSELPADQVPYELTVEIRKKKKKKLNH